MTQQPNGVDMIKEIVNLLLLKGSIGKAGAGVCPVRGHSNVQGNRTMLINENRLNVLDKETRKNLESEMINYLFGEGSALPQGYTPPKQ